MPPLKATLAPLRLVIQGEFWDSQVYAGKLFLFGLMGHLVTIDWTRAVSELRLPAGLRALADAALLANDRLYQLVSQQSHDHPKSLGVMLDKFRALAKALQGVEAAHEVNGRRSDNLLPFPHNDSEIHYHRLYVGSSAGLFSHGTEFGTRRSRDVVRYTDVPALDIAAGFSTMAQAAGSDGLFDIRIRDDVSRREKHLETRLSADACDSCEWAFGSVLATGYGNNVYLASFEGGRPSKEPRPRAQGAHARERVIGVNEFFETPTPTGQSCTWGARDKIYRYNDGRIEVIRYTPTTTRVREPMFQRVGALELPQLLSIPPVVSARTAPFGSVIEHDEGLLIVPTIGHPFAIAGEPVSWRVFPRSRAYMNHLHVIYDDHIEIIVFTHDYFADQRTKLSGTEVAITPPNRSR